MKCYICGGKASHEAYQPDFDMEGNYKDWDYRSMCCSCFTGEPVNKEDQCKECELEVVLA